MARDYPFGTLISAPRIAALIDSGYLNFYMQGKWVFVAALALMLADHAGDSGCMPAPAATGAAAG